MREFNPQGVLRAGMTCVLLVWAGLTAAVGAETSVRFATDVVPILTRLGCNSGGCHGKESGQNGFKLSLLGFEPALDYLAIVKDAGGRRILPQSAERSLLLLKATGGIPHGGGRPLEAGSEDYRFLSQWIDEGAIGPREDDPTVERLSVTPARAVFQPGQTQQITVTAHFSNGETRDVTRQAVLESNEPELADVTCDGVVTAFGKSGLFTVMARFGDQIDTCYGTVPFANSSGTSESAETESSAEPAELSDIDRHLFDQWRRLGVRPSALAGDGSFIRRATLDICGRLPTPEEVSAYQNDPRPDKRERLIDRLLEQPEYASYFALKWADILQNRGRGYSTSRQRPGTALFTGWIRDSIAQNKPYDQFAAEIVTASGSQNENPPTVWYRSVRTTTDYVESVAQAFLGVRIQCAQCHHHPAERWSQSDYYSLAAVFARVGRKGGFADAEVPTDEVIYLKQDGEIVHPRTGEVMPPQPLGGKPFALSPFDDPRQSFARWMTAPDNPYFARTMANRMWGHFLGRGIIHPIDDARSTNPPSNPELLDALTKTFVESGFDVKHLIRTICNSYAYRLSSESNASNIDDTQCFSRFYPRRLPAEVLLDAHSLVLDVPTQFSGSPGEFPAGTRAIELPDENVPSHFLDVFGRPARDSACECERVDAPALAQGLELVNSSLIQQKLTAENGYIARLAGNGKPHAENVRDVFMRVFAREPREEELRVANEFLDSEPDRAEAFRSLLWSLLATNEFMVNH